MSREDYNAKHGFLVTSLANARDAAHEAVKKEAAEIATNPDRVAWSSDMFKHAAQFHVFSWLHAVVGQHPEKTEWAFSEFQKIAGNEVFRLTRNITSRSTSTVSNLNDDHRLEVWANIMEGGWGNRWYDDALYMDPDWKAARAAERVIAQAERDAQLEKIRTGNRMIKAARRIKRKNDQAGKPSSDAVLEVAARAIQPEYVR